MPLVYILYSLKLNRFYTGFTTLSLQQRVNNHSNNYYDNKFTSKANDWIVFLEIECATNKQALKIEAHIKRMKSSIYIRNLIKYPEIIDKLKVTYFEN